MKETEQELTSKSDKERKKMSSSTKAFIIGAALWSVLFIIIPLFIYLGVRDWTLTFSVTGKIGIGLVLLGFVLLGAVGTPKVTGGGTGKYIVDYTNGSDGSSPLSSKDQINFLEILAVGEVMMLLWGVIYLIPFAFGVPFMI